MPHALNRREALGHLAAVAAATAAGRPLAAHEGNSAVNDTPVPIVDTHLHLWDLDVVKLPWLEGEGARPLARNFLMADYLKAADGLNVVKAVYMEVNVAESHQVREAEYVLDLCGRADNPLVAAVIGGSPQSPRFKDYITPFAENRFIKGVRTVLHDPDRPRGMCLERQFVENIRLLGKLGLKFDLCMRPGEIGDGVKLAERCPRTQFVVDHCGNMSVQSADKPLREAWMKSMRDMAALENTVCKISGIVVTAREDWQPQDLAPNVEFCLETFGEDRCYFAGDWPVCTLRATLAQWVGALKHIVRKRSPEFQRKLFYDNAARVYGLD